MDFGAFVELEPGIEGLVHISELSHKRVWRAADVVKEGDEIEVLVLNVNPQAQRMSLSIKGPAPTRADEEGKRKGPGGGTARGDEEVQPAVQRAVERRAGAARAGNSSG